MGAHPKAPSMVRVDKEWASLVSLIEKHPVDILGSRVAETFGAALPYLFKVLAAAKPLSIQAHPSIGQAREGFERENRAGIPFDAPYRNYKDPNHKPECICALTPFWALCGFRPYDEMISLFEKICPMCLYEEVDALKKQLNANGFKRFFNNLISLESARKGALTEVAASNAANLSEEHPVFEWVDRLYKEYPGDIGILAPVLLNLVCLEPGEALYLPAGKLHAYLDGTGIELMANSDNVLRGGLTPKHVDVDELLKTLTFEAGPLDILKPESIYHSVSKYITPAEEFCLSIIQLSSGLVYKADQDRSVEIMLCVKGEAVVKEPGSGKEILIGQGDSILVPASVSRYTIEGSADIYMASVPG